MIISPHCPDAGNLVVDTGRNSFPRRLIARGPSRLGSIDW